MKRSSWVKRENETSLLSLPFLLRNDIFFAPALIYTVKHLSFEISPKTIFNWKALKIVLDFKTFVPLYFSQWACGKESEAHTIGWKYQFNRFFIKITNFTIQRFVINLTRLDLRIRQNEELVSLLRTSRLQSYVIQ